eukprot:5783848-Pleurochrysis_carterae.AAC.1
MASLSLQTAAAAVRGGALSESPFNARACARVNAGGMRRLFRQKMAGANKVDRVAEQPHRLF